MMMYLIIINKLDLIIRFKYTYFRQPEEKYHIWIPIKL